MKINGIIYVGLSGFPSGFAMVEKVKLISLSLIEQSIPVIVVNRKWADDISLVEGTINGIKYCNALGVAKRPRSFLVRNLFRLLLPFKEMWVIYNKRKEIRAKHIIINSRSFSLLLFYYLIGKIYGLKLVITYVEHGSSMATKRKNFRYGDYLFERFAFKLVDAALPISDYLIEVIRRQSKSLPILKTPVLTDIDFINDIEENRKKSEFVFCGAAAFIDVIRFVVESFDLLDQTETELVLICGGTKSEIKAVRELIDKSVNRDRIKLLNGLSYSELINFYKSSLALLIPLRPTIQDMARFPHKIGEYAASGRPIISIKYGEVANYFSDGNSALLASEYSTRLFAEKMQFVIHNPILADKIGLNGKNVAINNFGYKNYGIKLVEFLNSI